MNRKEEKLYIHEEAYKMIDATMEEWLINPSFELWDSWARYRQKMGDFLVIICGCLSLRERLDGQTSQVIRDTVQRFRARVLPHATCTDEDYRWLEDVFLHPLVFAVFEGEEVSLARTADFLQLPITASQVETVQDFLREQETDYTERTPKNQLELLIATEIQCAPNRYDSLFLALLSQHPDLELPSFISDIHQAQAFCSAWGLLEKERGIVQKLQEYLRRVVITPKWSYGAEKEYFVLMAITSETQESDFSWGKRHIWVFEDLLSALAFLWELQPLRSILVHSPCTYPNAVECSDISLQDGMYIEERSVLGYESKERVFLEGDFWSVGGMLEKTHTEEEEQRQEQANAELARFLLDVESDPSED